MKRFITSLLTLLTLALSAAAFTQPALAWSPFGGVKCGSGQAGANSAVCKDAGGTGDPVSGSDGILMKVNNIIAVIAGIAAVIIIVMAGLKFIQSGGNSEEVARARSTIIYASVGLVIIVLARTLIALILSTI